MLRGLLAITTLLMLPITAQAQSEGDLMTGVHLDIVKTDYTNIFQKIQTGAEVNYFATRSITATAGFEFWSGDGISLFVGSRWYPKENTFVRVRALVGANDINIGAGWSKPLNESFRFEAIGDFYFDVEFAIRVGLVYTIRK